VIWEVSGVIWGGIWDHLGSVGFIFRGVRFLFEASGVIQSAPRIPLGRSGCPDTRGTEYVVGSLMFLLGGLGDL
jgi:hypothetical protein